MVIVGKRYWKVVDYKRLYDVSVIDGYVYIIFFFVDIIWFVLWVVNLILFYFIFLVKYYCLCVNF